MKNTLFDVSIPFYYYIYDVTNIDISDIDDVYIGCYEMGTIKDRDTNEILTGNEYKEALALIDEKEEEFDNSLMDAIIKNLSK